ncbi:unnamed protein product [Amoebophrya sp. A120]|nr:unnamed protein product [Amoebophrya sp. A120]|eukprot:GSA120T00021547001.1
MTYPTFLRQQATALQGRSLFLRRSGRGFASTGKKDQTRNIGLTAAVAPAEPVIPSWKRQAVYKKYPQTRAPNDGAMAAAYVAYAWSDQAFIYPITPATPMGDCVANWAGAGRKNLFGEICEVTQMQSEAGAAGACHGVVEVGSCVTTFTSSQGLLLMVPTMYILAGALNPCVFHVAARAVTKHALCIFGDQTDVMATRQTGFALLCGNNVQQAMDMALVSHVATLKTSIPFMNFFDGFRTSHELSKPAIIPYEAMAQLVPHEELQAFRQRGLNPNRPHSRQLGQFADTFFQNSEAANKYYDRTPGMVQDVMNDVGFITGRQYKIFTYKGVPDAEHVVVIMGSGACVVDEYLQSAECLGKKYGVLHVKLYRPWDAQAFMSSLPRTVKTISVLDRTKESGSVGEPLYMDVATSLQASKNNIQLLGGRYGLGSREFTPGMVAAVYDNAQAAAPKNSFTVGIDDDVTFRSLVQGPEPDTCPPGTRQCVFWGMGSDGTVSANKAAIKLIGENTEMFVQGYFAYDSKKAGGCTISHLRFGPTRFESPYQIQKADYVGISETTWPRKFNTSLLETVRPNGVVVFNQKGKTPEDAEKVLPVSVLHQIAEKQVQLYFIDAERVARSNGLGRHTNNILSQVFFYLSEVIPWEKAQTLLENNVRKTFKLKGEDVINRNLKGMSEALENLNKIEYDVEKWRNIEDDTKVDMSRPAFVREVMDKMASLQAESLPVSAFDPRGHYPNDTCGYEKRGIAYTVPIVDMNTCTQCNKCSAICPHAAIRPFLVSQSEADEAPDTFDTKKAKGGVEVSGLLFRIQVAPEDCTGCEACSWACGDASLTMTPLSDVKEREVPKWDYAVNLPNRGHLVDETTFKGSQFQLPQLEFSGACEGCGETPYAKLVTQLFGPRMVIANSSGCSSVWSGTAGFSPFSVTEKGQGPAWGRSLFENAAEYGFGMARAIKQKRDILAGKVEEALYEPRLGLSPELKECFQEWLEKKEDAAISMDLAEKIPPLMDKMRLDDPLLQQIRQSCDDLQKISCWIWGGDGWAYDIGFGGLDHVLAGGTDINILVMDTEGYSNTESRGKNDADNASARENVTILVGTDTGNTSDLAQRTADMMRARGFLVELMELNEIADISDLENREHVMLMCSTAGEGDMPQTADSFWEFINDPALLSGSEETQPLKNMKLSSFGLGDTSYRHFNKAVLDIEKRFVELGATPIIETGMGNDQDDDKYETAFEEWLPKFWQHYNATEEPDADLIPNPSFELQPEPEPWTYQPVMAPSTKMLTMEFCKRITPADFDRIIYHIRFDRKNTDYNFLLGDAMSIYPKNDPERVKDFLNNYLGKPGESNFDFTTCFKVLPTTEVDKRKAMAFRRPLTVMQMFTEIIDILGRPNKHFYKNLARFATDEKEKKELQLLIEDSEEGKKAYKAMADETVTYVDVLNKFKSAHPPLEHLISMIPCVKPRLYSIASSPRFMPDHVELMIVVNDWETPSGKQRIGLNTDYIHRCETDSDPHLVNQQMFPVGLTNGTFNFPQDTRTPMIMTGLGTGLAPFRGFLQEWRWWRETMNKETGPMWLFYGCRYKAKDFCFADELYQYEKDGILTELRPAFSRDQKEKIYVQTRMSEVPNELYKDLVENEGYFYLCGQAGQLEIDVENAIKKAVMATGKYDKEKADEYVEDMHHEGRYNLELY